MNLKNAGGAIVIKSKQRLEARIPQTEVRFAEQTHKANAGALIDCDDVTSGILAKDSCNCSTTVKFMKLRISEDIQIAAAIQCPSCLQ